MIDTSNNKDQLFSGIFLSLILHVILLSLIVYLEKKPEEEVKYIQAELWSSLPPESTTKNENSFRNQEKNTAKSPTKKIDNFKKTPQRNTKLKNDEIGIDKEKAKKEKIAREKAKKEKIAKEKAKKEKIAREKAKKEKIAKEKAKKEKIAKEKAKKEKIAKEKAKKEKIAKEKAKKEKIAREKAKKEKIAKEKAKAKLIAEQRAAEMERLKRSLPGIDSKAKNKTLGLDNSTRAGVTGGSSDGDRVGELADYSEKISSKIRRKIVFDLSKTKQNPKVVYKVIRKNNKYNEIQLINSSGNSEWDIAVRDAILRSIPLPDPDITEIPIPPPELELVFRPRDF